MRKVVFIAFVVVILALFFSSCGVSPEKALENIQNPNVEFKTKLNIPLVVTSISVGEFVTDSLENAAGSVGGEIVNRDGRTYIVVKKDATLLNLQEVNDKLAEFNDSQKVADFSQTVDVNLDSNSVDLPNLSANGANISFTLDGILKSEGEDYETPATKTDISLGVTSNDVASITVNGSIKLSFSVTWSDVYVTSIDATIMDGEDNIIVSVNGAPVSNNEIEIPLDNVDILPGENGTITLEYSLKLHSDSDHTDSGDVNISIVPILSLVAFKDAKVTFEQEVTLPDKINALSFKSGSIILSSNDLVFDGVEGSFGSNPLSVDNGNIIVNLSGISLPAYIRMDKISGHFISESQSSVNVQANFSDNVVIDTLTMELEENQKLSFSGSKTIDLPGKPKLKELVFSSGYIKFLYNSKLPVGVDLRIWSDQIKDNEGNAFDLNETINNGDSSIDVSFDGMKVVPDGTQIVIWYEAAPEGYDDSGDSPTLTIRDVALSSLSNISFEATVSYGDFSLKSITISDISESASDTIDLSNGEDFLELLGGLDMNGTLTLNIDINGSIDATLSAYKEGVFLEATNIRVVLKDGEAVLDSIFNGFKEIMNKEPDRIDYNAAFNANDITIDFTKIKYATMTLEVEIPAQMTLNSSKLIYEHEGSIDKQNFPEGATITTAILIVEGTNTTGITPVVDFLIKGKDESVYKNISTLEFNETFSSSIILDEESMKKLGIEGMDYKFRVWLREGKQEFRKDGKIELKLKLSSDIIVGSK